MNSVAQENIALRMPIKWLLCVGIYIGVVCGLHFGFHVTLSDLLGLSLMPFPCYWLGSRQARQEQPCSAVRSSLIWGASFFLIFGSFLHYLVGMPYTILLEVTTAATCGYFFGWRRIQG